MDEQIFQKKCILLTRQLRFEELKLLVGTIPEGHDLYWNAQYGLFEGLLYQGRFGAAQALYEEVVIAIDQATSVYISFRIRYELLKLQTIQLESLTAICAFFDSISKDKSLSPYNRALALTAHGKAILLGISLGMLPANQKHRSLNLIESGSVLFGESGFTTEYHENLLYLVDNYAKKPYKNIPEARKILELLVASTTAAKDLMSFAKSKQHIAVLNFREQYRPGIDENKIASIIESFEELTRLFEAADHLLPEVIVKSKFGELLLAYGIEEGLIYLKEAIDEYGSHDLFVEQQMLLREISGWFLRKGDGKENIKYEEQAALLNEKVKIPLGAQVSHLAKIELAHRQGNIGLARSLYAEALEVYKDHPLIGQMETLYASCLSKVRLVEESILTFRKVLEKSTSLNPSSFLSDAYTNLAANLMQQNLYESASNIEKAIAIDSELGDDLARVQHTLLYVQILWSIQKEEKLVTGISNEIGLQLDECLNLLKDNYTHEASILVGQVLQTKGYLLFLNKEFEEAEYVFSNAESILLPTGAQVQLSFLCAYQGMNDIELARLSHSIPVYDRAIHKLVAALSYFEVALLKAEEARMNGLIAICNYESGRLEVDSFKAADRWRNAEDCFENAYQIQRYLRLHSDPSEELSKMVTMTAFGEDTLTYPEQAFKMHYHFTQNINTAIKWLERTKTQALKESMLARSASNQLSDVAAFLAFSEGIEQNIVGILLDTIPENNSIVVQYYFTDNRLLVFGFRKDWEEPKTYETVVSLIALNKFFRNYLSGSEGILSDLFESEAEAQWAGFSNILAPILEWTSEDETVVIIPHKILHQLPLHTLKTPDGRFFIERNNVIYSPSLSVLVQMQQKKSLSRTDFTLKSASVFGDSRNNLCFAKEEVETVAQTLQVEAYTGDQVTKNAILDAVPLSRLLHIAVHGELSFKNGWDNGLLVSGKEKVTAADIFPLKSSIDLVVLSGCETGVSQYSKGDELSGLISAFLHAGVQTLIVSQWKTDDKACSLIFRQFYQKIQINEGLSKAHAFRQVIKSMIDRGMHFCFWGAFKVYGSI